jgi:hypothetical protein
VLSFAYELFVNSALSSSALSCIIRAGGVHTVQRQVLVDSRKVEGSWVFKKADWRLC